jgi:hypothetical protein
VLMLFFVVDLEVDFFTSKCRVNSWPECLKSHRARSNSWSGYMIQIKHVTRGTTNRKEV